MMLRVVDPRHQHSKTGLAFENAFLLTPPSEEPYFLSMEGFGNMLLSPTDIYNPTALAEPTIYPSQHQMKQYLDMENESANFNTVFHAEHPPEKHSTSFWSTSPSTFKTSQKRTRCYDLRSQSTAHLDRSGSILPPDRARDYGYGPIPSASSDVHGPIEGSSITSYSESESETASSGFSLSPNGHEHEHEHDPPCVLAPQVCDPPGLYSYMGGLRVEAVPGFDRQAASETSVCSYDGSIDDECKPVSQNTSWAAGNLSDGSMLQDSPSVGTATDSFGSSCGAVTPLSWSAFNAQTGIDMSQEEPAYGDTHALWPSTQQFPDEPTPFLPVATTTTSHYDPAPRVPNGLPPPEEYQNHNQRYYHQEQQPIRTTPNRPEPFNIPLTKDHPMTGQFQLPADILPLSYHINPAPNPIPTPNTYYAEYIHRHPKLAFANDSSPEQPTAKTIPCQIDTRNALLIEYKRRGLSYKDIKRIGGFREAESTLRGRFRTLTKAKDQRVRKPMWSEKDINLLCEAVTTHAERTTQPHRSTRPQAPRVSWKKVAQYIRAHGGSYHFGNATCKKKWCEVHGVEY